MEHLRRARTDSNRLRYPHLLIFLLLATALASPGVHAAVPPGNTPAVAMSPPTTIDKQVEAIRDIAGRAIESSKHDLDIVVWIFGTFAFAGVALGYFGYRSADDVRKSFKKRIDQEVAAFADARVALATLLSLQIFVESNYAALVGISGEHRKLLKASAHTPSTDRTKALEANAEQLRDMTERLLSDLHQVRNLVSKVDDGTSRWTSWVEGWTALILHRAARYSDALRHFEKACELTNSGTQADNARLASHRYNMACCLAMMGKKQEALKQLRQVLALSPWRYSHCKTDSDLENLWTDSDFLRLISDAQEKRVSAEEDLAADKD